MEPHVVNTWGFFDHLGLVFTRFGGDFGVVSSHKFDFAKVFDILDEIKKYHVPDKHKEILSKLDTLMEDLDVDTIKELLSSVI